MAERTSVFKAVGDDFSLSPPRPKATALQAVVIYLSYPVSQPSYVGMGDTAENEPYIEYGAQATCQFAKKQLFEY